MPVCSASQGFILVLGLAQGVPSRDAKSVMILILPDVSHVTLAIISLGQVVYYALQVFPSASNAAFPLYVPNAP